MEALEIERQTDQTPLTSSSLGPAQGELAEAQHLFDDPDHRFDGAFACSIDRFAQRRLELVGHLDLGTGLLRWGFGERGEPLLPTGMMGITTRGNVGLDAPFLTRRQGCRAKIPGIQRRRLGRADGGWDRCQRRFGFLRVIGMIGKSTSHDEQTLLIHSNLRVIILLKAGVRRIFHDARLRVREVVLVTIARSGGWRARWATTWTTPHRALSLRALRQFGLILGLLGCHPLLGTGFQHRFGLRQPCQAVLPSGNLLAYHQPIRHLWLVELFTQGEELLDLRSKLGLQLPQTFVADRFALGGIGMHFGPIQTDRAQLQHTRLLGKQEHLHEQLLQLGQEGAPKGGQCIMVGMQIACDEAKGHRLIGGTLNLARTEHSGGIAIQQQAQQHFGGIWFPTAWPILGIQRREVQLRYTVYYEARQMLGRQTVTQAHRQIERLIIVHGFKSSLHAHQYTMTAMGTPASLRQAARATFIHECWRACQSSRFRQRHSTTDLWSYQPRAGGSTAIYSESGGATLDERYYRITGIRGCQRRLDTNHLYSISGAP